MPKVDRSTTSQMLIRPLVASDRIQVQKIVTEVGNFSAAEIDCALELLDLYLQDEHQEDYRLIGAGFVDLPIQAYCCWGPTPMTRGTYDLYWIATHPQAQGRGMGRALMHHVEERVRAEKGRLLVVETSTQDSYRDTIEFYLGLGYRQTSVIRDFYDDGDDKLIFTKRFPG